MLQARGINLRNTQNNWIKVGDRPSTNFIEAPFFQISLNPILILIQNNNFRFDSLLSSLIHCIYAIGEMYNLLAEIDTIHELLIIDEYTSLPELRKAAGRLRFNPVTGLRQLYGLRPLGKFETMTYGVFSDELEDIRRYGTHSAALIQKVEGIFSYQGIADLYSALRDYSFRTDSLIFRGRYKRKQKRNKEFEDYVFQEFDSRFRSLREDILDFSVKTERILDNARTTVQLNVAVVALIITAILTLLPFFVPYLGSIRIKFGNSTVIP